MVFVNVRGDRDLHLSTLIQLGSYFWVHITSHSNDLHSYVSISKMSASQVHKTYTNVFIQTTHLRLLYVVMLSAVSLKSGVRLAPVMLYPSASQFIVSMWRLTVNSISNCLLLLWDILFERNCPSLETAGGGFEL